MKNLITTLFCFFLFAGILCAQDKRITGTVYACDGGQCEPAIGASVVVKGTRVGVITDRDGHYTLLVPNNATIVVSFIGYRTETVKTKGMTVIDVHLTSDNEMLDEVAVTAFKDDDDD